MTEPAPNRRPPLFAAYAEQYRDAGWAGVLPIPYAKKKSPPDGFTGHSGAYPTEVDLTAWTTHRAHDNIALRMPPNVIGIDVDNYGTKKGGATLTQLEAQLGPLPDTWTSTSRTDGVSGIRFYRLPEPTVLIGALPGIEIIQRHHRYAIVYPSMHDEGRQYQWIDPDGVIGDHIAHTEDLPLLPPAWIDHLRAGGTTTKERRAKATGRTEPSDAVTRAFGGAARRLTVGTRHDGALEGVTALIRLEHQGHPGADQALDDLSRLFLTAVLTDGSRSERDAESEWHRMLSSAEDLVATTPSTRPDWDQLGHEPIDLHKLAGGKPTPPPGPDDPWPEPTPLPQRVAPVDWPTGVLPPWIEDHARAVAASIGTNVDLTAMLAIGALSIAAFGHIQVSTQPGYSQDTNLYLVVALPPTEGKSPAHRKMIGPLRDWETARMTRHSKALAEAQSQLDIATKRHEAAKTAASKSSSQEDFTRAQEAAAEVAGTVLPPSGQMFVGDTTPERLAVLLSETGERIAVVSDEGGVLDVDAYRDRATDPPKLDLWLQAWSGEPHQPERINRQRQSRLDHPLIVLVATAQPELWESIMGDAQLRGRGFPQRLMASVPTPRAGTRNIDPRLRTHNQAAEDAYTAELVRIAGDCDTWANPGVVTLDEQALDHWVTWAQGLEDRLLLDLAGEKGWVGKMRDQAVPRLAALLHVAWGRPTSEPIDEVTMARATTVGNYWLAHRLASTLNIDLITDAQRLLGWALRQGSDRFTPRELGRTGSRHLRTIEETARPLALLAQHNYLRPVGAALGVVKGALALARGVNCWLINPQSDRATSARQRDPSSPLSVYPTAESPPTADLSRVSRIDAFGPSLSTQDPTFPLSPETRATRATEPPGSLLDMIGAVPDPDPPPDPGDNT